MVFEHVEKLVTVAASLHRKFLEVPRLAQGIFSDFYGTYDPVIMGINSNDEENKNRTVSPRYSNKNLSYGNELTCLVI